MEQHRIAGATRRTVLAGIAAALVPGPLAAQVQQRADMRRVGVLMALRADDPVGRSFAAALVQGLGPFDWREGDNLRIDWRWASDDAALFVRYAAELVSLGPDVLVAAGNTAVESLRRQTSTLPIVFTLVSDPVGQGFVERLAHPGGNITGFSSYDPPMAAKWLEMLTQITPPVARVAMLYNPTTTPYAGLMLREIEAAARSFALTVRAAPVHDDAEVETMITRLAREERAGLLVLENVFTMAHRDAIVTAVARHRLPAVYPWRPFVAAGGLMSYGTDQPDMFRRAAVYVDRILKGAKPSELPVQLPTKFVLVINLKTAKELGVTFPTTLLATADEVIE